MFDALKENFPPAEKIKAEDREKKHSVNFAANFDFLLVARFYENRDPPFASLDITPFAWLSVRVA